MVEMIDVRIEKSWKKALHEEFEKEYFEQLIDFVKSEYEETTVYPNPKNIFKAFELCPFDAVRAVLLGQDPYHGRAQAQGLCFSVRAGTPHPPSLQNIFKEIQSDLGRISACGVDGDLTPWAEQGVLLLNATLTVRAHEAGSHQGRGWEIFTDAVVRALNEKREGLVFVLWGKYAQEKGKMLDWNKHLVLEAAHPSPFSAHNGFFGCKHFSQSNEYLVSHGQEPIIW